MRDLRTKSDARDRRGFAIVTVLFVIGLLMVLGAALTATAIVNSQNTVNADVRERAYNTAESGVADVLTGLGNGTITQAVSATWSNANSFPSANDTNESYDYNVTFNTSTTAATVVHDPLTYSGQACGSTTSPGYGCAAIPPLGVLIDVRGHYGSRQVNVEAEALANDLNLQGYTLLTKGDAGTNGNGSVASDPCSEGCPAGTSASHNVKVMTDGNFNGGKGLVDGNVYSAGTATATIPNTCTPACVAQSSATPIPFPASNNLVQDENQWKLAAVSEGHYFAPTATLPSSITVNSGDTWFINQNVDLKNVAITNNGGMVVITGSVTESGNNSASNYGLGDTCNNSCTCHSQAQLIGLSTNGINMHGQGTGKGHLVSQGVIFAPSGPATNIGNGTMQAAIVSSTAQVGGVSGLTADVCAAQAQIPIPGYNITGYGEN